MNDAKLSQLVPVSAFDLIVFGAAGDLALRKLILSLFQRWRDGQIPEQSNKGFKVALVTDGRMSGASGKVPAAIHLSPEALAGGAIAKIRDGDIIMLDAEAGVLELKVDAEQLARRSPRTPDLAAVRRGVGRELFATMRVSVTAAEKGAMTFGLEENDD